MAKYVDSAGLRQAMELQKTYIDAQVGTKQDAFTVGTGLSLQNNVLSITIDHTLYKIVNSLPAAPAAGDENKIHVVPSGTQDAQGKNIYIEYIWVSNDGTNYDWEKLGEYKLDVDLTPYQQIADLQATVSASGVSFSKDGGTSVLAAMAFDQASDFVGTVNGTQVSFALKNVLQAAVASGFYKVAVDAKGRVTGTAAVTLSDLTDLGVATAASVTALETRVGALETWKNDPLTTAEVVTMFNEVYGTSYTANSGS